MLRRMRGVCLGALLLCSSCADGHAGRVYVNAGSLCLRPAGERLHAEVKLPGCVSSACNRQVASACTIQQEAQSLSISSRLVLEANGARCANDCGIWISNCDGPAPRAGDYTVTFGELRTSVALPLAMDTELLRDGSTRGCSSGRALLEASSN
jgi:hypothetical protein